MTPMGIHTETMAKIKLKNSCRVTVNSNKLSEHIAYWQGRGYCVVKGRPVGDRKMEIKVRR